jgi:hypothetical protein
MGIGIGIGIGIVIGIVIGIAPHACRMAEPARLP